MNFSAPKSTEQSKAIIYLVGGLVVVFLIIKFGDKILNLFSGLTEGAGLADSKEGKDNARYIDKTVNANEQLGTKSPWSPQYYKDVMKKYGALTIFTTKSAEAIAKRFYDSVGYVYDTPSMGLAAMKQIATKVKLSQVVETFNKNYNKDLLTWLNDKYDAFGQREYLRNMLEYAENLPVR
mgnify:CR=1 FL=1